MQHNGLDKTMMKKTSDMIFSSNFNLIIHLNQTLVLKIWKIKCFYRGEMHQQLDMIPLQPGEYSFTCEVINYEHHQRSILVSEVSESKKVIWLLSSIRIEKLFVVFNV